MSKRVELVRRGPNREPLMTLFTCEELRRILYCCAEELRARAAGKPPGVRPWLSQLVRRLELEHCPSRTCATPPPHNKRTHPDRGDTVNRSGRKPATASPDTIFIGGR